MTVEYAMNTAGMSAEQIDAVHAVMDNAERCPKCNEVLYVGSWPFCKGGHAPADRLFNVIGDEIVGGFVQENFGVQPETFYSKRAMSLRAKELGLEPMVRHVGKQGSDKSDNTSRWV